METHDTNDTSTVIIIGGGLVGSLAAHFMLKRGYKIELYEKREDLRTAKFVEGRSINLALSNRARRALREIGLEEEVLKAGIPMTGRLLHSLTGETKSVPYDCVTNKCLYSISRNFLNIFLLKGISNNPKAKLFFDHKLVSTDLHEGIATFLNEKTNETIISKSKLILAADGAFSTARRLVQRSEIQTFSQTYIEHGYLELNIAANEKLKMISNHLHIWPRGSFMMIALPNFDGSWTVTLFMPFKIFDTIKSPEQVIAFFKETFPDFLNYVSEAKLIKDYFSTKPSALISIKCNPYHFNQKLLLIGDAAHAMVPFYGQGMNAGFEDVLLLDQILEETKDNVERSLELFSERRVDDAHAICDLAMYNYIEMRDLVTKPIFQIRKKFDELLFKLMPNTWIPLYNSVTFSKMRYSQCVQNREWQNKVLNWTIIIATGLPIAITSYYLKY